MHAPRVPVATYRLQFHRDFRFADARALVPYLDALGVSDLYASPLLAARRGSTHGYDVTDPMRLNPELGTREDLASLTGALRARGMGLLLDLVPNHMAASEENPWWWDVLAHGPASPFASFFDIDWHPPDGSLANTVLLPILGSPYETALENQELTVGLEEQGFCVRYHDRKLPLAPRSWGRILTHRLQDLEAALGTVHPAVRAVRDLLAALGRRAAPAAAARGAGRGGEGERPALARRLWDLYRGDAEVRTFLDETLRILNGKRGDPASFGLLDRLLGEQAYRLCFWPEGNEAGNYRRFFATSDLVGLRVEEPAVFEAIHALPFRLVAEGQVTGFRVDHIDGLLDPLGYLRRLREGRLPGGPVRDLTGLYVVVEKILCGDEALPAAWPVHGTTGYDFLNAVNALFVEARGVRRLRAAYARAVGVAGAFAETAYAKKKQVLATLFAGEFRALAHRLERLAEQDRHARDLQRQDLDRALAEVTAGLPVYRTYTRDPGGAGVALADRRVIARAVAEARRRDPAVAPAAFAFLRRVLLLEDAPSLPAEAQEARLRFVMRWQQLTGPVMAKGVEDSALYAYTPLVSLNEVGGDPGVDGLSPEAFHRQCRARQRRWRGTLSATSTHDTKRSEDVRARIDVLSEVPEAWEKCLARWRRWNRPRKRMVRGRPVPDGNEEILLYQTLVGTWPLAEPDSPAFRERLRGYAVKAAREAAVHTSWVRPDVEHERALGAFVDAVLTASPGGRFRRDFVRFLRGIAWYGAWGALGQVLLKIAAPGVPDFYQGAELWDFRLVDPDNRGPVDFAARIRLLDGIQRGAAAGLLPLARDLLSHWEDGRIKLYLTWRALTFRRQRRDLFAGGAYLPLTVTGGRRENVFAFARRRGRAWALVAVPRLLTRLTPPGRAPVGRGVWGAAALALPGGAPERWANVLTGETLEATAAGGARRLQLTRIFRSFPVALLAGIPA